MEPRVDDLLARAQASGFRLMVEGGELIVSGPRSAAPLVEELREHREAVREAVAERQAIRCVEIAEELVTLVRMASWSDRDLRRALAIAKRDNPDNPYTAGLEAEIRMRRAAA